MKIQNDNHCSLQAGVPGDIGLPGNRGLKGQKGDRGDKVTCVCGLHSG